jgi:hypothetical protein
MSPKVSKTNVQNNITGKFKKETIKKETISKGTKVKEEEEEDEEKEKVNDDGKNSKKKVKKEKGTTIIKKDKKEKEEKEEKEEKGEKGEKKEKKEKKEKGTTKLRTKTIQEEKISDLIKEKAPIIKNGQVWIFSVDPGSVNLSFSIEEYNKNDIKKIKKIENSYKYENEYNTMLQQIYKSTNTIITRNANVTQNCNKSKYVDMQLFHNITHYLDSFEDYLDQVSYVVVEQQMSFGRKKNTLAVKIAQHIESYFIFKYGMFKDITEFPSYHKTNVLKAPKKIDKPARKKWAIQKATEIWTIRNDTLHLNLLSSSKKKDDISDCLCMCLSFIYINLLT